MNDRKHSDSVGEAQTARWRARVDELEAANAALRQQAKLQSRQLKRQVQQQTHDLRQTVDQLQAEVAERIEAEEQLRRSHELLERMFDNIYLCVVYLDTEFNFIRVNEAYAATTGRTVESFVGQNHFGLYPHAENEQIFRNVVKTGHPATYHEKPFEFPDDPSRGITYWDWILQPVKDEHGKVVGLIFSLLDVTDRVRARRQADDERRRLFAVMNMFPGYVVLKDRQFRIRYANHGFLEAFGEPEGRPCYQVEFGRSTPCADCSMLRVLADKHTEDVERVYPNGRTYHVWTFPYVDSDGEVLSLQIGIDVSELRHLERTISETTDTERRRIGRELHDTLGQSLTGLGYLVEAMARKAAKRSPEDQAAAGQIVQALHDAISQVRLMAQGLDPVGLAEDGLSDSMEVLAETLRRTTGLDVAFHSDPLVRVESFAATQLYRIAQEALTNVARHAAAKHVEVRLTRGEGVVELSVVDDGVGLSSSARRTDGTGLRGMQHRASAIGARLSVAAGPSGGTAVVCVLPTPPEQE